MNSIDEDAKLCGINPETWNRFKQMYVQDDLPGFLEIEAEAREACIDKWDTTSRLAKFFCNMDKCKDPKVIPLCRQQKKALMKYFTADYRNGKQRS